MIEDIGSSNEQVKFRKIFALGVSVISFLNTTDNFMTLLMMVTTMLLTLAIHLFQYVITNKLHFKYHLRFIHQYYLFFKFVKNT